MCQMLIIVISISGILQLEKLITEDFFFFLTSITEDKDCDCYNLYMRLF